MKPPKWAYVIGILMLLFGGCGMVQDYQTIHAPKFLDMGESIFDEITEEIAEDIEEDLKEQQEENTESESSLSDTTVDTTNLSDNNETIDSEDESANSASSDDDTNGDQRNDDLKEIEMVKDMLNVSDYYKTWMVRFGYVGIVVSILFIFAGVFMMIPKNFSIPFAYAVLGISLVVGIVQYIIFSRDDSSGMVTMFSGVSVIFSVVIDIILLAVIIASDKDAYSPLEENFT